MISDIKELSAWIFMLLGMAGVVAWVFFTFSKQKSDASEDTSLNKGG